SHHRRHRGDGRADGEGVGILAKAATSGRGSPGKSRGRRGSRCEPSTRVASVLPAKYSVLSTQYFVRLNLTTHSWPTINLPSTVAPPQFPKARPRGRLGMTPFAQRLRRRMPMEAGAGITDRTASG